MFDEREIDPAILRRRAFNLRWATVPEGVIPLTAADPDFRSAPPIAEAICRYAKERYLCYGPPEGIAEFRASMARYYRERRSVPAVPGMVIAVDSAAFGIYLTCRAFLKPGEEAIIFDPVDYLFRYSVEQLGAKAVPLPIPQGSEAGFERLEKLITPKTRMICLCNPLNPTGKVFTRAELETLGKIAVKHSLVILSDEIWSDIIFRPNTYTSMAALGDEVRNLTVTVTGFSKSYGMAGLRIGTVVAHNQAHYDRLMAASLHQSTVHGANVLSQVAAAAALDECAGWLEEFVNHLHGMRDYVVERLNGMKGVSCTAPEGCYVAFADITGTGRSSAEMQQLLMDKARVAVVPGLSKWFGEGAEGYIRLSFATSRGILKEALDRMEKTINTI